MKRLLGGLLAFVAVITMLVLALMLLNRIPLMFQKDMLRRYDDLDEVRTTLNMKDIAVPAYFPQDVSWPPFEILAQGKPFPAVFMKFKQTGTGNIALVISQSEGVFNTGNPIEIVSVTENVEYLLKGRKAVLTVGIGKKGEPCCRITWKENSRFFSVTMRSTPFELTKIAESMIH
jgi:hypothetical protein